MRKSIVQKIRNNIRKDLSDKTESSGEMDKRAEQQTPESTYEFSADLRYRLVEFTRRALAFSKETPLNMTPLTKGGSDRTFYRFTYDAASGLPETVIAMHYNPNRKENTLYADIAAFLQTLGVAVPKIMAHNRELSFVVMEDLGAEDLWTYRLEPWTLRRDFYRQALKHAHRLHHYFQDNSRPELPVLMEGYDEALYTWEHQYFRQEFVEAVCGLTLTAAERKALEEELAGLTMRLMYSGIGLVHRDLQSQNIMIFQGKPVLIDFQGLRTGSPFYDLGSLLYDPYVNLTAWERLELLAFYYNLSPQNLPWPDFVELFHEGSAQRLMQALGAYGFLGPRNRRADFLAHIPAGLRHLLEALSHTSSLPQLHKLTTRCVAALKL
jgi:aminoglycoside/choline kinase family phosphotransferase